MTPEDDISGREKKTTVNLPFDLWKALTQAKAEGRVKSLDEALQKAGWLWLGHPVSDLPPELPKDMNREEAVLAGDLLRFWRDGGKKTRDNILFVMNALRTGRKR